MSETDHGHPDKIVIPAKPTPARDASPRVRAQGRDKYYDDKVYDPFNCQLDSRCPRSGAYCIQCRIPSTHDGGSPPRKRGPGVWEQERMKDYDNIDYD